MIKFHKYTFAWYVIVSICLINFGCNRTTTEPVPEPIKHEVIEVRGEIRGDSVWTANNIYRLHRYVYIISGATLTIEPGTVIMGVAQSEDSTFLYPASLIVEAGGKIIANGTAEKPIVFTSSLPPKSRYGGAWGGLVLIGKAPHNRPKTFGFNYAIRGTFGDSDQPADNSGSLQYVRIEYAGGASCCNDLSSLALFGVGSGTTIDHLQVSYSGDDSFDWYGGTVNARHLVSFCPVDDDFDVDWGYTGHIQFAYALRDPATADASGSNCIESDNFMPGENLDSTPMSPHNGLPLTQPIFANVSAFAFAGQPDGSPSKNGSGNYQSAMHIRRNSATTVINSVFAGWPEGLRLDGTMTGTWQHANNGSLELQGVTLANVGDGIPYWFETSPTLALRGDGQITNKQTENFFGGATRSNDLIPITGIPSLMLHPGTFHLNSPGVLPQSSSPLLINAVQSTKLASPFFTSTTYRGAFGSTNWTLGWTNWQPHITIYDLGQ